MTITVHEEGTRGSGVTVNDTWTVVQTTSPNTTDGVFQFGIGLSDLVAGNVLEARVQVKDAAAGILRTVWQASWAGAQSIAKYELRAIVIANDWDFALRLRSGTGVAVKWSIVKVT